VDLREKMTVDQMVKKFPAFYINRRFIPYSQESTTGLLSQVNPIPPFTSFFFKTQFRSTASPSSRIEVKNAWSYTSTSPYVFMAWSIIKIKETFPSVNA